MITAIGQKRDEVIARGLVARDAEAVIEARRIVLSGIPDLEHMRQVLRRLRVVLGENPEAERQRTAGNMRRSD